MSPPSAQKGPKLSLGATPSKRQSLLDTLLNFGKPNYAPLTPIEILPGIMSNDGVATVFQLDTRKPRTQKQAAKREAKKRAASATSAVAGQMRVVPRREWQDALQPGDNGYFGSVTSSGSGKGSTTDQHRSSPKKSFIRALVDDGTDEPLYEQMLNPGGFKKNKGKHKGPSQDTSDLGPPYPVWKPGLSPTDKLTVRHANPFTGLLSRNQTELNVSRSDSGGSKLHNARMSGASPPSPPYPHSRYRYPALSSPSLSSAAATFEDLVPMPSVHEPAPFSYPGATAEEIDEYERALKAAATNVANHLAVPIYKNQNLSENVDGTRKTKGGHFLALDGGLEQQRGQERRSKHKKSKSSTRTSSLQDRHLQTPVLRNPPTTPLRETSQYPYQCLTPPPENPLQSASNRDYRLHSYRREQQASTSTSTTKRKEDTHTPRSKGTENGVSVPRPPAASRRMETMKPLASKVGGGTSAAANASTRGKGDEKRLPKRTRSGPGLAVFDVAVPFIDPRELAEYRRARAGLPPLKEREGVMKQTEGVDYRPPFPFKFEIEDPSSGSVTESDSECGWEWDGRKVSGGSLRERAGIKVEKKGAATHKMGAVMNSLRGLPKSLITALQHVLPGNIDLSPPPAAQDAMHLIMAFLEPVLTLSAPPQFWELPVALRVLLGMWYFVIVTWGILVVVRVVGIVGEMVALVMVPVRGVVWVARVICGG